MNPKAPGAVAYGIGLMMHLMMGAGFGLVLTMGHPLVKSGEIPAPGPFMTGFGRMTPQGMFMAHAVFGLVTGVLYAAFVG